MPMPVSLGELLIEQEYLSRQQLDEALEHQRANRGALGQILVKLRFLAENQLTEVLAHKYGVEGVDLSELSIPQWVIGLVPRETAERYCIIPIFRHGSVSIAMEDPTNLFVLDDIKFMIGGHIEPVFAPRAAIGQAIERCYGVANTTRDRQGGREENVETNEVSGDIDMDLEELERSTNQKPVVKLCNLLLADSLRRGASEIHVEPYEREYQVRFRIDGVLYIVLNPPMRLRDAIANRFKVMAKMDIAEKRIPQGGRIRIRINTSGAMSAHDFELHTLPTPWGEKLFLRVHDLTPKKLAELGLEEGPREMLENAMSDSHGLILVCGPRRSGKTQTLYSAARSLPVENLYVAVVEEQMELDLPGVTQVQADRSVGDKASVLRTVLAQDPDVVVAGSLGYPDAVAVVLEAARRHVIRRRLDGTGHRRRDQLLDAPRAGSRGSARRLWKRTPLAQPKSTFGRESTPRAADLRGVPAGSRIRDKISAPRGVNGGGNAASDRVLR